jgi:hypothetical protein
MDYGSSIDLVLGSILSAANFPFAKPSNTKNLHAILPNQALLVLLAIEHRT